MRVCLFAFDCIYLNGDTLLQRPLRERREALYSAMEERPGFFMFAQAKVQSLEFLAKRGIMGIDPVVVASV